MRYIYTKGPWKEFMGYVFYDGRPTDVTDRATLERLQREPDFQPFKEIANGKERQEAPAEARVLKGHECPRCHIVLQRGWYAHQKWCRVGS